MNFEKVFIDANVFADIYDTTRPMSPYSVEALRHLVGLEKVELVTSCDLVTTVYYVAARKLGKDGALKIVEGMARTCEILPFTNDDLVHLRRMMAKDPKFTDLEDALQYLLAEKAGCDLILTNDRDFHSPRIERWSTETFVRKIDG